MSDQYVRMQYSDDGQPNFSEWDEEPIGEVGQYGLRIVFTRTGSARNRVYRFRCSSPRRRDMLALVANIERTDG
jgi:hypothetical protein